MSWTAKKIKRELGGKLIGTRYTIPKICKALLHLPDDTLKYVCKRVWFISSSDDAWAFVMKGSEVKNRYLIYLSDELFQENDDQITYTILHEVGHVVLKHRNSIGYSQTKTEIRMQEKEADAFAKKYIIFESQNRDRASVFDLNQTNQE